MTPGGERKKTAHLNTGTNNPDLLYTVNYTKTAVPCSAWIDEWFDSDLILSPPHFLSASAI